MIKDGHPKFHANPSSPATGIFEVTPSDVSDLPWVTTGISAATPGTVRVTSADGSDSDVVVTPGQVFPLRVTRIWASGTTATGIRGLT
ncbi:spike base protein, RCAP_Rcc01079 family [Roseobacter sp. S98]|uniref:spike base protein, RCAP_Rcc01079 family n=1 Tax=Roseobacter algicola (ex Choi et al. 2025) (nom. illeg.) TaxID=3092138 RepID=UPI003F512645